MDQNGTKAEDIPKKSEIIAKVHFEDDVLINDETSCGIWFVKGSFLQRFANKKAYVFLYGVLGCLFSATFAYHNGTITTLEKRFKIPSRNSGVITIGNDLSTMIVSIVVSYYTERKHRPRWIALGLYTVVIYCLLTASPHLLYGAGDDALYLTKEYGADFEEDSSISTSTLSLPTTSSSSVSSASPTSTTGLNSANSPRTASLERRTLCSRADNESNVDCEVEYGNYAPQAILFSAQFISGIGGPLYYTLGLAYLDDNVKKSKTPVFVSYSYFLRMLGPCIGYTLASFCLKIYISPTLTPTITNDDPRWLGAWWLGWIILGTLIFIFGSLVALFPKTLPRAAARRLHKQITQKEEEKENELPTSFKDMGITFKRIISNPILITNNLAAIFYFIGYMPYWIFLPKYIETQYRQSSSASSLITGTVGLVFSAIGVLLSGIVISRFKPKARKLAAWNVIVGVISIAGIFSYAYLGCVESDNRAPVGSTGEIDPILPCNADCNCDFNIKYSPVCSTDGSTGFLTACHAGCTHQALINGSRHYTECSCIHGSDGHLNTDSFIAGSHLTLGEKGVAKPGNCLVDCTSKFYVFLVVVCLLKFSGATGKASNYLVTVRSVEEKDKAVALGFSLTMMSLWAFVPSPILFGIIIDKACLLWGKTCTGSGNCWLYNGEILRYTMNYTAAAFVAIGTFFDVVVWYLVKDLIIFDEELNDLEIVKVKSIVKDEIKDDVKVTELIKQ